MDNKVGDISENVVVATAPIIRPNALWYELWEGLVAITCILSTLFVTFQLSFRAKSPWLTALTYLFDIVYISHIAIQFYVPYSKEGSWVTNRSNIKQRYARREFIVDVLSVFPLELFSLAVRSTTNDWQYLVRIERLNRILRFYNALSFLGKHEGQLGFNSKVIRCFKYSLVAFTLMHIISCGWYMLACPNESHGTHAFKCYGYSWAVILNKEMELGSTLQRYMKCFYWATITATSTGYGDISAVTPAEKWFSIFSMLCGVGFFFGPILGYMASTLTNSDSKRARYTHRIGVIKEHLINKSVSQYTQKRVTGYYEHLWNRHQGVVKKKIFHELPMTFQAEISLVVNKHVIEKAPLFQNVSVEFMRMISLVIKPAMYIPKQVIFNKDDIRHTLFYISKGSVEILTSNSTQPAKVLKEGSFFGEAALLLNIPRAATVRAAAYCELLLLNRADLTKVLNHFPKVGRQLYSVINTRCDKAMSHIQMRDSVDYSGKDISKHFISEKAAISCTNYVEDHRREVKRGSFSISPEGNFTFNPNGKFLTIWNIIMSLVLTTFVFVHTFVVSYQTSFGQQGYGSWFGVLYLVDVMYLLDMFIYSRTGIQDENESLIDDPKLILRRYVKTSKFWLDLISVLPIELPFFAITDPRTQWLVVTFVRTNRIVKLYHVFLMLKDLESDIGLNIAKGRFIKLAFMICGMCHLCSCIWFLEACYGFGDSCASDSWVTYAQYNKTTPLLEVYVTTLYWAAATMTSTGYGDISAHTTCEEFIATLVFLIGLLLFGYCLSNIAATLTNKLYPKVQFMGRINAVVSFIKEQKLSGNLVDRVEKYLALIWRINKGEAIPGVQLLMGDMPSRLQLEVSYEELQDIISKVTLFRNTDEYFIKLLSSKLITYVFMPGDMVVYRGDVGREMYIIRRGLVEVLSQDQSKVVATLGRGSFFGEVGLIFGESRTADVRTKTYCEVAMLQKSDLDEVLQTFPLVKQQFKVTSTNPEILDKIKTAAFNASDKRKVKRIELIEHTKTRRSRSVFHWKNNISALKEEEIEIYEQLKNEFKEPYDSLHHILYYLSYLLLRKTIHPSGKFFHAWTLVSVIMSCIYYITIGLQFSFLTDDVYIIILNYVIDVFFLVDIYIKFHVGFFNKDGILITHPTATATNYLKTNFLIDFLAFAPFDIIILAFIPSPGGIYPYMKLNRFLHIFRVSQYFSYLEDPITSTAMLIQGMKFSIYIYLIIHVFASAWFKIGCPYEMEETSTTGNITAHHGHSKYCLPDSWAVQGRHLGNETPYHQYVISMYWAATTACAVGYGDIHAYTVIEKTLSLLCMIFGVVFFGYIIASLTASLANADAQRARYQEKLNTVNRFLTEQRVELTLTKRVKEFYKFSWNRNKGVNLETLFEGLPNSLQADITLSLYKDIIESVPLFQGTELGFTKMLSLYIKPLLLPKGEYIVRKGDIGEEMFFIHEGTVEVVSEHASPIVFDTMSSGRFFGEISTIFSCPRTASVRTQTNADLFVLKKKDLDVVLGHYPHIRKQIMETAEERQKLVQERAKAAAEKKAEDDRKKAIMVIAAMRRFSIAASERQSHEALNETGIAVPTKLLTGDDRVEEDDDGEVESLISIFRKRLKSAKLQIYEWSSFTIGTGSRLHWWKQFNCLLLLLSFLSTTYMASFHQHVTTLFIFNIMADFSFYTEIFLKFHMAYFNISGNEITEAREITTHYLKGEFPFDLIANFPLWIFSFVAGDWTRYYAYLSLLQVLRLKRLNDNYKMWLSKLDINVLLVRLSENAAQIIIQLQVSACTWYIIGCHNECNKNSWVKIRLSEEGRNLSSYELYTDSVYWALSTMTSTGYGDIVATKTNTDEMVFAGIVMVVGKILFGFVLGNVASTMANLESLRVAFEERFTAILAHMEDQDMPIDIQARVINFFQYIWRRNKGSTNDGVFDGLPNCLHAELYLDLTGYMMKNVPMFSDCELPFIRAICTKTKLIQFHESEFIYRKGDIGNEMYFITRGEVEITNLDDFNIFGRSEFFGDESLVTHTPRLNFARALTHVDMFSLHDSDLSEVFHSYPEEAIRIHSNIEKNKNMGSVEVN